ncbi:MAG: DNA-directed RNA polymerase subunit omega [Clostridia bacterium]|nr:DNA-directed RNA polymerase subunit omega [Clostridia bacterium]
MLNPSIGKLIQNYENRYRLVMDIAKMARDISGEAEKNEEILIEKPVSIAIDKLASERNV